MSVHREVAFEEAIERAMLAAGWLRGDPSGYDRALGLDTGELFAFVGATQVDEWQRLMVAYGTDDPNDAQRRFAARLAAEIDARGALDVLRHGVRDRGVTIRVAYFRPAHTLADDALNLYRGNRLTVTRQLHYSATTPDHSLDLALFVNGVPVATAELKNQLTSQTVEHSKAQYRRDRDPRELLFDRRALVHFAVDQDLVFLTTRLAGERTRFLPFNTGSAGPGVSGGAGNPPAGPGRYRTSYLWEQVWQPDAWLDLLRRFVHVEKPARRARVHDQPVIFPRFHQWHAVREMTAHAAEHGAGRNYLVMHSAGSGKSNTIAWLVHRLSSLHSADDRPVFDKVVVITDRDVLDRQLQDTIYQFDHVTGVVTKITDRQGAKSTQVADALADETTKILIVTVQTFPYVLDRAAVTPGRRYAVVVDEAHSSQSGESAAAVKRALLHAGLGDVDDDGDLLTASALARGRHDSLSYFAFTATPKAKTIELFGTPEKSTGTLGPFHTYSMRQAIDEGFILDVLRNYVTYQTYWKLANANPDDPEVDPRKASAQLARYAMLHPTSMTQRAELIVDHFHSRVAGRLGGRAKAMVVTRSREHAVRLYRAIVDYAATRGYTDCAALVAFSGELEVDGISYTEPAVTGMPERELPEAFAHTRADDPGGTKDDYRILVVAEKYQTGFDQPLLTTMYVDKKLDGVAAVQTLSRLNRTHPRKSQDDVFVLDLANDAENIQAAFAPYYETAITEPTDPNVLYTAERAVLDHAVLVESEMRSFAQAYLAAQRMARDDARWARAHGELYRLTDPARDRFVELREREPDAAEDFRGALRDFVRLYGFLSQVVSFVDEGLERLYVYGKHLLNRLPKREDPGVDIGQVDLTHLRISRTGEHDVSLSPEGEQVLPGFTGDGAGRQAAPPDRVSLSDLIKDFNDRFGTSLGEADLVRPMEQAAEDPRVQAAALVNTEVDFAHVFDDVFEEKVIERVESNTAFLKAFSDDEDFKSKFTRAARSRAYEMIRRDVA